MARHKPGRDCRITGALAVIALFSFFFCPAGCNPDPKETADRAPSPPAVEVVQVIRRDVPVVSEWVGTLDGVVNATIRPQVSGYLIRQNYREGDAVKKGQILFEIDPRRFQTARDQAQAALDQANAVREQSAAALEQAKAEVARTEARHATALANLKRIRPLAEEKAVSRKDLDDASGDEASAQAQVRSAHASVAAARASALAAQAAVHAARAALEKAELDLGFTRIHSPIDGIAGIAKAQIGNLVGPGVLEELTTVSQVNPIKVYIFISEQEYLHAVEAGQKYSEFHLELILADGRVYPHQGEFVLADRRLDPKTGTIRVGAHFVNPGYTLRPGQFARIRATTSLKRGALLVPQRAVVELQGSYQVSLVGPDNRVEIRKVKAAERIQNLWVIDQGLKAGEQVIVEGVQKVKQGMLVAPRPYLSPEETRTKAPAKPAARPARPAKR